MTAEKRPQALTEALSIAPKDPLADGRFPQYAEKRIQSYRIKEPQFGTIYEKTSKETGGLTQEQITALNLYLAATAFTLASFAFPPASPLGEEETLSQEAKAADKLLRNLISQRHQTEEEALNETWKTLYPERDGPQPKPKAKKGSTEIPEEDPEKLTLLKSKLEEIVTGIKQRMREEGFVPGIRDIQDSYKEALAYAREIGIGNPPLFNFTIGNIDWVSNGWEEQFSQIPEILGMKGTKKQRIAQRKKEYEDLMERAGINIYGYKDPPLGWPALLKRHKDYLTYWGFSGHYQDEKAFLAYGGSDGTRRAFLIARETIKNGNQPLENPKVLFPTPGFTMIAQEAENTGMEVVELPTTVETNFHPTAQQIMQELNRDPSIRIVNLTPFTNPGTTIGDPEEYDRIFRGLEEYRKKTGITVYVILDMAYLGQGDEKRNRDLVRILDTYKHRFDIIPTSTKIWQRPSLRCCGIFTPDEDLASNVIKILRSDTITLAYSMQAEALAVSDFVSIDDIRNAAKVWKFRQKKMREVLEVRPDLFPIVMADSTLYTCNILSPGIDPVDFIKAGFFFTPDNGFYLDKTIPNQRFVRAALGMIPMTEENITRMKKALIEADITPTK